MLEVVELSAYISLANRIGIGLLKLPTSSCKTTLYVVGGKLVRSWFFTVIVKGYLVAN